MINVEIANTNHLRPQLNYAFHCARFHEIVTIFVDIKCAEFRLNRTNVECTVKISFTFRIKVLLSLQFFFFLQNSHLFKSMTWRSVRTSPKKAKKYEMYR
jgi:hypothetical protein